MLAHFHAATSQTRLGEVNTRQHKLNIRADATVIRARKGANDETSRLLRQIESEACVMSENLLEYHGADSALYIHAGLVTKTLTST